MERILQSYSQENGTHFATVTQENGTHSATVTEENGTHFATVTQVKRNSYNIRI